MPEASGHLGHGTPLREQHARVRVTHSMEARALDTGGVEQGVAKSAHHIRLPHRRTQARPEYEVVFPRQRAPLDAKSP